MLEIEPSTTRTGARSRCAACRSTVQPGEVVAVTGPSGCGKSTLLHVAAGIVRPQAGEVRLLGHDLDALDEPARTKLRRAPRRHRAAVRAARARPLGARERRAAAAARRPRPRGRATAAADWLERAGVDIDPDTSPSELSGGQAQRVAVARALVTGPAVIFADEPTGSMDTIGGERLLELLLGAARERGAAVVLVTHDNVVAAHADREIRLRDGSVEAEAVLR